MLCRSAACAVVRRLAVCPSVRHDVRDTFLYSIETSKHVLKLFFIILVFPYKIFWRNSNGFPLNGAPNIDGYAKTRDFRSISCFFLRSDTQYDHSCNKRQIGSSVGSSEKCYVQWSWLTLTDLAIFWTTKNTAWPLCDSWANCSFYKSDIHMSKEWHWHVTLAETLGAAESHSRIAIEL